MSHSSFVRVSFATFLLAGALGMGSAGADTIAVVRLEQGVEQRVEMAFASSHLEASTLQIGGPHYAVDDSPPYLVEDNGGRAGADLTYEKDDVPTCAFSEDTPGWSLTVEPAASGATLTSTVPGCEGTIQFVGDGVPGVGVSRAGTDPGLGGTGSSVAITISRLATATGSFAGPVSDLQWAQISYTRILEPGVGLPPS